jgi:hypothetical protein
MKNNYEEMPDKFKILYEENYWDKLPLEELERLTEEFNEWKLEQSIYNTLKKSNLLK